MVSVSLQSGRVSEISGRMILSVVRVPRELRPDPNTSNVTLLPFLIRITEYRELHENYNEADRFYSLESKHAQCLLKT